MSANKFQGASVIELVESVIPTDSGERFALRCAVGRREARVKYQRVDSATAILWGWLRVWHGL
jgi:hypothetical protein